MSQESNQRFGLSTRGKVLVIVLVLVGGWLWYVWPKATVEVVKQELEEHAPLGTQRAQVEAWLQKKQMGYSYSQKFESNSMFEQNGIVPGIYSGYIVAIIRDASRDLFVTWDIQIYLVFDAQDKVALHLVHYEGTGL
jgi:hypothetical protein